MMTLGSVFDGIGGFPLAAVHNSIIPVWASEIEPFPMEVTKIRFPGMLHMGDITKLDGAVLPPVDVICGGSPCQDLSVAGKRQGLAGERSGLFMEQVRIVKEMRDADGRRGIPNHLIRPRYLVWENVPGAFSSTKGEDFRAVLEEIIRIKDRTCHVPRPDTRRWESAGAAILGNQFSLAWRVLDAQFWGVAQRRRRIFLVADFGGITAPEILFKHNSLFRNPAPCPRKGQGTTAAVKGGTDDTGGDCLTPWDVQSRRIYKETGTWPALYGGEGGGHGYIKAEIEFSGNLQAQSGIKQQMFAAAPRLCLNDQGGERIDVTEEVTATLRASMSSHQPLVAQPQKNETADIPKVSDVLSVAFSGSAGAAARGIGHQPLVFDNHAQDSRFTGPVSVSQTVSAGFGMGGNNVPLVKNPLFFSLDSNSDAGKNQKNSDIPKKTLCISGNIIDRQPQNGGNGIGYQQDLSYTLTATDHHAVFSRQRSDEFNENDVTGTQSARQYKDATDLICKSYQETIGTIGYTDYKGINNQYISEDKCIVEKRNLIRRLTPLECERLQGFPDGWTDIPGASDSARYKALGNSVAIPCVDFVLRGIAYYLRKVYEE